MIVQEKHDRSTFVSAARSQSSPAFEPPGKKASFAWPRRLPTYGSEQYPFAQRRKATDDMGADVRRGQSFSAQGERATFERIVAIVADGEAHPTFADPWFAHRALATGE